MAIVVEIKGGPSEMQMMMSLMRQSQSIAFEVVFTATDGKIYNAVINKLEREDGSGKNWNIGGFTTTASNVDWIQFHGFYSSKTRKGTLEFV